MEADMKPVAALLLVSMLGLAAEAAPPDDEEGPPPKALPFFTLVSPPLAGKSFLCHVLNRAFKPVHVSAKVIDQGGEDITTQEGHPFIPCDFGDDVPIAHGVTCSVRGTSQNRDEPTAAHCVVTISAKGVSASAIRASLLVFSTAPGGGVAAAVEAH
jgi:hypothetical protein